MADNFQKNGSYIPGIRPGNETERYVRKVLNRVTFIGAAALVFIAALPVVLTLTGLMSQSLALGGTGLIIVVGVALELNSQIDGLLAGKSFEESVPAVVLERVINYEYYFNGPTWCWQRNTSKKNYSSL